MEGRLYCGIDFHKNTSTLCTMDGYGKGREVVTIRTSKLALYLSNKKNLLIGIEASGGTNDVVQKLKECGHDVRIINPNKFKAIGMGGKKTDERDATAIAEALRLSYIPEVHHKSLYARELKSLIVGREMIVRTRVNMTNHVRGILREYGITMPQGNESFAAHIKCAIASLECPFISEHLSDLVDRINDLKSREKKIEERLETLAKNDVRSARLRSIPGVGLMTAMTMIAVLDDHARFKDGKHFASYLGLVPRENSSGDKRRMGSITRSGSEILRRYLIHGARTVLMHSVKHKNPDENRMWALRLKGKVGMNKATVALAHRLSRIAFAVLRDDYAYGDHKKQAKLKKAA